MYFSPVNNLSLHPNNLDVRINQLTFCIPIKEMEGTMHGLFPGISEFSPDVTYLLLLAIVLVNYISFS